DVHVPRQRPDAVVVGRRRHRAREERGELGRLQVRREIEQPSRARELRDPDAVEHHHVEARAPAFEVDDVELVLVVRRPRQRLALDAHPGMLGLELAQQRRQRIGVAENARVLEHERDRPALARAPGAAREGQEDERPDEPRRAQGPQAHDGTRSRASSRPRPRNGTASHAGRLSSSYRTSYSALSSSNADSTRPNPAGEAGSSGRGARATASWYPSRNAPPARSTQRSPASPAAPD